jgi:hypothetical protein
VSGRELDKRRSQAKGTADSKQASTPEQPSSGMASVHSDANGVLTQHIAPAASTPIDTKRVLADQES